MALTTSKMLSQALREQRYKKGLSQVDVAKQANLKQSTISNFENNASNTKIETLFQILASLELEIVIQPRKKSDIGQDEYGDIW